MRAGFRFKTLQVFGLLFLAGVLCQPLAAQPQGHLPQLMAEDLNEQPYALPNDLPADRTLLLIAFKREQQANVDTWIKGMALKESSLPWLELPVLEDYGSWFKWFVDNGMRRGIKSEFDRSKVVTVYTDKAQFKERLGLPTEATIFAVVVQRNGQVLAQEAGDFTPEAANRLVQAIRAE